jgi:hypothetical protein
MKQKRFCFTKKKKKIKKGKRKWFYRAFPISSTDSGFAKVEVSPTS